MTRAGRTRRSRNWNPFCKTSITVLGGTLPLSTCAIASWSEGSNGFPWASISVTWFFSKIARSSRCTSSTPCKKLAKSPPPLSRACDGPFEVIDHRNQVLEEILGTVLGRLLALAERPLAEILELGLEAQQPIVGIGELLAQPRRHGLGLALRHGLGLEQSGLVFGARRRRTPAVALLDRFHRLAQRGLELRI